MKNNKTSTLDRKMPAWFKLALAYVAVVHLILLSFIFAHIASRNDINFVQAEKIARLEAIKRCLSQNNGKFDCANLDLFNSSSNDPGFVSREGVFSYNFKYGVGQSPDYFQADVTLDKQGNILSDD